MSKKAPQGYRPDATSIGDSTVGSFISEAILSEDLNVVPGIGPATAKHLKAAGIETTHQLMGQFLMLRKPGFSVKEHCDAFWLFLQSVGVTANRNTIVKCVAEKAAIWIPGLYSEEECRAPEEE